MADEKETNAENAESAAAPDAAPQEAEATPGAENVEASASGDKDPMAEYAELKAEREQEKAAPKEEAQPAAAAEGSPEGDAPKAEAVSADPMPHPIEEYQAYKAWKARQKAAKGGKKVVVAEGEDGLRKPGGKYAGKVKAREESRRNVLLSFGGLVWLTFAGSAGALGAIVGRFLFPNVLYEPPTTFKIGSPKQFLPNSVDTSYKSSNQIWVVRDELGIYVIKAVCTHLGCTPNWLATENKFKCPCHGSGFRMTGMNFEGPAPRPLERFKVGLAGDGQIIVDTSKVFLQESQWTNPEAYIPA